MRENTVNRTLLNVFLAALLLATAGRVAFVEWTPGPTDRQGMLRGRDFQVFYIAGRMIADGEAGRLYDHQRLQEIQKSLAPIDDELNPPYCLFYPPMAPLLVSPLARLPYAEALALWWTLQGACFLAAGWLLINGAAVDRRWRTTVALALLAFYPVWDTVLFGQLSAVLLLVLVAGFHLQRRNHRFWAGLTLSLLAMKPQYLAGAMIYLALRRDWRTLAAAAVGLVGQLVAVAAILSPAVLAEYVEYPPVCGKISLLFRFSPWAEHGPAAILQNLLLPTSVSDAAVKTSAITLQLLVAAAAGWMLFRAVVRRRQTGENGTELSRQQTAAVLFMLLLTPHALTYDLALLAVPLANLWSAGHWKPAAVLYAAASVLMMPVYGAIGFSLVPVVLLATLYVLSQRAD
ncbi:MAG: DUF2029 domain-containing protein [Pirellulales bacterium]|nr:DUF2029 domain-containing protein [Pirellulales bacterium]